MAVEAAEEWADGRAVDTEAARRRLESPKSGTRPGPAGSRWRSAIRRALSPNPRDLIETSFYVVIGVWESAWAASAGKGWAGSLAASCHAQRSERKAHAALLRDIVGDPFRPQPTIDRAWLEWGRGTVLRLAETIYRDRTFGQISMLGDALEDAGCTDAEILNHLRSPAPHVRGCWALDLVFGRQ
jgi:hypothetical protein